MFNLLIGRASAFIYSALMLATLSGCANVAMQKSEIEKIENVELIRVVTPPLNAPSFMQGWVNSGTAGFVQAAIAQNEKKTNYTPEEHKIEDFGVMVATRLQGKLPKIAPWFPKIEIRPDAVPSTYVLSGKPWLKLEVFKYELGLPGMRYVIAGVDISLRSNENKPLWTKRAFFSGLVHGGEKIDMDRAATDPSQLKQELERAADWITNELEKEARN